MKFSRIPSSIALATIASSPLQAENNIDFQFPDNYCSANAVVHFFSTEEACNNSYFRTSSSDGFRAVFPTDNEEPIYFPSYNVSAGDFPWAHVVNQHGFPEYACTKVGSQLDVHGNTVFNFVNEFEYNQRMVVLLPSSDFDRVSGNIKNLISNFINEKSPNDISAVVNPRFSTSDVENYVIYTNYTDPYYTSQLKQVSLELDNTSFSSEDTFFYSSISNVVKDFLGNLQERNFTHDKLMLVSPSLLMEGDSFDGKGSLYELMNKLGSRFSLITNSCDDWNNEFGKSFSEVSCVDIQSLKERY